MCMHIHTYVKIYLHVDTFVIYMHAYIRTGFGESLRIMINIILYGTSHVTIYYLAYL